MRAQASPSVVLTVGCQCPTPRAGPARAPAAACSGIGTHCPFAALQRSGLPSELFLPRTQRCRQANSWPQPGSLSAASRRRPARRQSVMVC